MPTNAKAARWLPLLLLVIGIALSACVPKLTPQMSHQGRLTDENGNPVADGNYNVQYKLYQVATQGSPVYTESQSVAVKDGLFTTSLGASGYITPSLFSQPTWLEITIEGDTLAPRQRLQGAPFAFSLASGAVVQGAETLGRTYAGFDNTGATMTVINNDATATGGHGLLAMNQATAANAERDKVAAFQAIAAGGSTGANTGAYGAIIRSQAYRGLYARGASGHPAAVFDSNVGIQIVGGGGCVGCSMSYIASNTGNGPIQAGDFVTVQGVDFDADLNMPVLRVAKATSASEAVLGVASTAVTRGPKGEYNGVRTGLFDAAGDTTAPGGMLSVVVQGLVQARAGDTVLQPGDRVSAGAKGATASPSGFASVMSAVDANGMVWVMLSGQ